MYLASSRQTKSKYKSISSAERPSQKQASDTELPRIFEGVSTYSSMELDAVCQLVAADLLKLRGWRWLLECCLVLNRRTGYAQPCMSEIPKGGDSSTAGCCVIFPFCLDNDITVMEYNSGCMHHVGILAAAQDSLSCFCERACTAVLMHALVPA